MSTPDEKTNPLYGLQVGSCVWETGKFVFASMINDPITKTIVQSQEWKSMSGVSDYVYTKEMNQGSFGIAGSYGFSGLSKLDVAASGYVGNSSAKSGKSVRLTYQVKVLGAIEHIDFDNLNAATLCAALADTTRQKLEDALEKYNALNAALDKIPGKTLLNVLADRAAYKEQARLYNDWTVAVSDFNSAYGDAMVIAVAWGGIGTVTMDITETSQDSSWKYGGAVEFSYARTGGSIAVSAAYDGNQSKGSASVKAECAGFSSGSCVASQVDEWVKMVYGKAFSELSDVKVLDKAPDMNIAKSMPSPPDFVKPKPTSTLAGKLGAIKNLDGLKLYAQASAYDKAVAEAQGRKPPQTPPDLATFLKEADGPANIAPVQAMIANVQANEINPADQPAPANQPAPGPIAVGGPRRVRALVRAKPMAAAAAALPAKKDGVFHEYVPLGVWISNWADLFPWLATSYLNSISGQVADSSIRYRVLIQDFLALSKLYYIADSCAFSFPEISKISFKNIANSFAGSCAMLQGSAPGEYEEAIQRAMDNLSSDALQIYTIWNKNSFLRSCELGLAVLTSDGYSPKVRVDNGNSVTEDLIMTNVPGSGHITPTGIFIAGSSKCAFDIKNKKPYTEFAECYKVLPLILPDPKGNGKIVVIGPGRGLLVGYHPDYGGFFFANGPKFSVSAAIFNTELSMPWPPMEFTANVAEKTLENTTGKVTLYPVPFSAANGIKWLGQAFSANVASDSNLTSQLNQIKDHLMNLPAWSLTSDAWKKAWTAKDGYSISLIRKQYVGMVDNLGDKLG